MKKCKACNEINKDNAKFCIKCGEPLPDLASLCPDCKSKIAPDDVFCAKCGRKNIEYDSKKETYKYIEKPVVKTGRNRNFKIFIGLISGFAFIAIIALLLVFVIDIGGLNNPFKAIAEEPEKVEEVETDDLKETVEGPAAASEEENDEQILELPKEELTEDQLQVLSMLGYPDEYMIIFDEGNDNKRVEVWVFEAMQASFLFEGGKYTGSETVITPGLILDDYNIGPEEFVHSMTPDEVKHLIGEEGYQVTETNTDLKTIIYGDGIIVCTYNTDNLLVYVSRSKKFETIEG